MNMDGWHVADNASQMLVFDTTIWIETASCCEKNAYQPTQLQPNDSFLSCKLKKCCPWGMQSNTYEYRLSILTQMLHV